ncbi:MAG: N-succinylarginine dihydrolase [Nevskiaceae bacterium]|nr:MAG: N-succinylarginine dihydrolase [Nevskiaceae bacterium]
MSALEANFDGLVGPTHNYAGLAAGNLASARNAARVSNPRAAALQGLAKMRLLAKMGLPQGVLPPQERPHLPTLRRLGYSGRDADILRKAHREAPDWLANVSSASSMWTANAATVSPSADTADGRVHFTPANLCSHRHRSLEATGTARSLQAVFADPGYFAHHAPLPAETGTADEGAANHTRLCSDYGAPGLELFVYGSEGGAAPQSLRYPARQHRAAGETIARQHGLDARRVQHFQQNPAAINAGAFHNDVVAVGNREVLLYHEQAFLDAAAMRAWICTHFDGTRRPVFIEIAAGRLSLEEAVTTYLFNSQLVCPPGGGMRLIVAQECREHAGAWATMQELLADPANPITAVDVVDLRQSMDNGGGPACLRLRVVLTEVERAAVHPRIWIDEARYAELEAWIKRHYRDRLCFDDLADPLLLDESRTALDRLTGILNLGSLYDFQR